MLFYNITEDKRQTHFAVYTSLSVLFYNAVIEHMGVIVLYIPHFQCCFTTDFMRNLLGECCIYLTFSVVLQHVLCKMLYYSIVKVFMEWKNPST